MSYQLRAVTAQEFPSFVRAIGAVFGGGITEEDIPELLKTTELDRTLAVFDGGTIAGTAGVDSFQLTVPGLGIVPAAGVTAVSVLPTHRRRGLLRMMMAHQLNDVRQRGEPLAILMASESAIYGRFGYGLATTQISYEIDPRYAGFATEPQEHGTLRLVDQTKAAAILPEVYDRARLVQPGAVTRSKEWWESHIRDPERWRRGASERYHVVYESTNGGYDGYATYRLKEAWNGGFPDSQLLLMQLVATTNEARAALWRYCFNVDLITSVQARNFSIEEPVRWMLKDPRRLRVTQLSDFLWLRLVDVESALAARRYSSRDRLVFEVNDDFCPQNSGRYVVSGDPTGAECRRTEMDPDIALQVADLGAAYLGGVGFTTLARAGRVRECSIGALRRADAMFACEPVAWCCTQF